MMKHMSISAAQLKGGISKYTIMHCNYSKQYYYSYKYTTINIMNHVILVNYSQFRNKMPILFDENF